MPKPVAYAVNVVWKLAPLSLPYILKILRQIFRARFFLCVFLGSLVLLLSKSIREATGDIQRSYCFGPAVPPMELSQEENHIWWAHQVTPVLFNRHKPIEVNSPSVIGIDLNDVKASRDAAANKERILILTPLRDAVHHLQKYFDIILDLSYPHELIDLGFLVGDTQDETLAMLAIETDRSQRGKRSFRSIQVVSKDFGQLFVQKNVRKAMGKARNHLLYSTLKPDHSWVFWRDVDVVESPPSILEDLISHDKDVVVPNVWFHRYVDGVDIEGRFDYNSWQESPEGLELANSLDKNVVLVEGYKEYTTNRKYMATMGSQAENRDGEIPLDGIGGVSILVKADVHRSGINFPCYAFENQAETEGFAKMAKRAGYEVVGLPNYVIWHIDTYGRETWECSS
ncbi:Anp1-domain-containing protein [Terfezia claveryi]|nr:Anp1-domain-containing protein [Terfezia claveryi]